MNILSEMPCHLGAFCQKPSSVIGLDDQSEEKRIAKEEFLSKLYYAEGNLNVDSVREESL